MPHKIIIAIDGYSSCGKSTLAKDLAKKLAYRYIDTGAMYRAVALHFYRNEINLEDHLGIAEALSDIHLDFEYDKNTGRQSILLNGVNVEKEIRNKDISDTVSPVSTIKEVRQFLVSQQQKMGISKAIVMDGRDIGTVVFPGAELKLFMTADEEIRIKRRFDELKNTANEMTFEEVRENIQKRDYIDSHREESPLRQAEDAIIIDNTHIAMDEQLDIALDLAIQAIHNLEK